MIPSIFARQPLALRKTAIVLIVALVLMWFDSKNPEWFKLIRSTTHAAMQPIYELSLLPSYAKHWSSGSLQSKEALRRENMQLKTQLIHAQAKLQQQDYILAQNARLQGILSTTRPEQFDLNLAQVIGTDTNLLRQIVVLNKGEQDGVQVGQTVIDEVGILGQIINVYPNTSRLLLITDEQQSVAVTVKRTGQRAIVTGEGIPTSLRLNYVFKTSDVRVGDELVSSAWADVFRRAIALVVSPMSKTRKRITLEVLKSRRQQILLITLMCWCCKINWLIEEMPVLKKTKGLSAYS